LIASDSQTTQTITGITANGLLEDPLHSRIWEWLASNKYISVGTGRKYNHLGFRELINTCTDASENDTEPLERPNLSTGPGTPAGDNAGYLVHLPKILVSEEKIWESISGHGVDHKRIPKLEWRALVGIASTKSHGIMQGDLRRLIDQDKRSLPRRTDALAQKGYIVKRTTAIRGSKTSKMWLKRFAPEFLESSVEPFAESQPNIDMSPSILVENLDAVPWHSRWTGDSIDYAALGKSIMAISKAWDVLRYHELKKKLGITGLKWQMRLVARSCRFFVQRGSIQYVAAALDGQLFKDCIKYVRDLTTDDWAAYLATGKIKHIAPGKQTQLHNSTIYNISGSPTQPIPEEKDNSIGSGGLWTGNYPLLEAFSTSGPRWMPEEPVAITVFGLIRDAKSVGITSPQLAAPVLGLSFGRHLTSLALALTVANLHPSQHTHFQVQSNYIRLGKSASYQFFLQEDFTAATVGQSLLTGKSNGDKNTESKLASDILKYGFASSEKPLANSQSYTSIVTNNWIDPRFRKRTGRKRKGDYDEADDMSQSEITGMGTLHIAKKRGRQSENRAMIVTGARSAMKFAVSRLPNVNIEERIGSKGEQDKRPKSLRLLFKVPPNLLGPILGVDLEKSVVQHDKGVSNINTTAKTKSSSLAHLQDHPGSPSMVASNDFDQDVGKIGSNAIEGVKDSDRSGKYSGRIGSKAKPFQCEKCGGSWKNDLGLKYHLTKSRTSCNRDYVPIEQDRQAIKISPKKPSMTESSANKRSKRSHAAAGGEPQLARTRTSLSSGILTQIHDITKSGKRDGFRSESPVSTRREIFGTNTRVAIKKCQVRDIPADHWLARCRVKASHHHRSPVQGQARDFVARNIIANRGDILLESISPADKHGRTLQDPLQSATDTKVSQSWHDTPGSNTALHTKTARAQVEHRTEAETSAYPPIRGRQILPALAVAKNSLDGLSEDELHLYRTKELVKYLVNSNGGAFPGEKSIWYGILSMWDKSFPGDARPNYRTCEIAVAQLSQTKAVKLMTHTFRDTHGKFVTYKIIIAYDIDPFSDGPLQVKAKIKESYPQPYVPLEFSLPRDPRQYGTIESQGVVSNRRQLAEDIEALDAPFYTNGVSWRKPTANKFSESSHSSPRQRNRRQAQTSQQTSQGLMVERQSEANSPPSWRNESTASLSNFRSPRKGKFSHKRASHKLHTASLREAFTNRFVQQPDTGDAERTANVAIKFLEPNQFLEDDPPEEAVYDEDSMINQAEHTIPLISTGDPKMGGTNTISLDNFNSLYNYTITKSKGAWPAFDLKFFESNDGSFNMLGWMPGQRYFRKQNLPQTLNQMMAKRRQSTHRTRPAIPMPYSQFLDKVDACVGWELSVPGKHAASLGSIQPDFIFINLHPDGISFMPLPQILNWEPQDQFTTRPQQSSVSTLRANNVPDNRGECSRVYSHDSQLGSDNLMGSSSSPSLKRYEKRIPRVELVTRTLSAIPEILAPFMEDTVREEAAPERTTERRLMCAFVAVRALLGGTDKTIDWGIIMKIAPDMTLSAIRKFWSRVHKEHGRLISNLTEKFQVMFLKAYDSGELPPIDYDNPTGYEWPRLVEWTSRLTEHDEIDLPPSKLMLGDMFTLSKQPVTVADWREAYYHPQSSVFSRFEACTSQAAACSIRRLEIGETKERPSELAIVKSWIRILSSVGDAKYPSSEIREKILRLASGTEERVRQTIGEAIKLLVEQRVICKTKSTSLSNQNYRLNEHFNATLSRVAHERKYQDATAFKLHMDDCFRHGHTVVLPYNLNDGMVMATINLQAHNRISIVPFNVPNIPMGFTPGNYESRKHSKSNYRFGLEIVPTEGYLYNEDITILDIAGTYEPPGEGYYGEIPIWRDLFGGLSKNQWSRILGAVLFAMATRACTNASSICQALRPVIEEFEVQMILKWSQTIGLLVDSGANLVLDEWWWLIVSTQEKASMRNNSHL
jgi:hypothetical protein